MFKLAIGLFLLDGLKKITFISLFIIGHKAKNVKPVMTEQTQSAQITSKPDCRVVPILSPR